MRDSGSYVFVHTNDIFVNTSSSTETQARPVSIIRKYRQINNGYPRAEREQETQNLHHSAITSYVHGQHDCTNGYQSQPGSRRQRASRSQYSRVKFIMHRNIPIRIT